MKVLTLKRREMVPQLEAAHIGAMVRLRRAITCPESNAVLDKADQVTVDLSERMGTCAGKAWSSRVAIRLNARLLAINPDELVPTYLHEFAHVVANMLFEKQCHHGPYWKKIMAILGVSDDRCHKMDVSAFQRPQKRFAYSCMKCARDFQLTLTRHKRQQHHLCENLRGGYICKCGGRLEHKP